MSLERVRFAGGALNGKVMWVDGEKATVDVHIGRQSPGVTKTVHYRRSGAMLRFVGESENGAESHEDVK